MISKEQTGVQNTNIRAPPPLQDKEKVLKSLAVLKEHIAKETFLIEKEKSNVVPVVFFKDVAKWVVIGTPLDIVREIKKRGCVIIREVVPLEEAKAYHREAQKYIGEDPDKQPWLEPTVTTQQVQTGSMGDPFFEGGTTPQIHGVYWNVPQIMGRQHENMATARHWLNTFWIHVSSDGQWHFDPSKETTYPDRQRIRHPGNTSGLVPHIDGGSVERWFDKGYRAYYKEVFEGNWEDFDPWAGHLRVYCSEEPSANVCTVFRSFQGWLALSRQGEGCGTLQVVPLVKESIAHVLLRPYESDVPDTDPCCGAFPGKQHTISHYHNLVLKNLVSIPTVEAGDMVVWHPDLIHSVEKYHKGTEKSSVLYIGAAPVCVKNGHYLREMKKTFEAGTPPPDFPRDTLEINKKERATVDHLNELGRKQMGYDNWPIDENAPEGQKKLLQEFSNVLRM